MNNSFERPNSSEHGYINQEVIDSAYNKALRVLSDPINPDDFQDIYGDVERDKNYVEQMNKRFAENESRKSLETINRQKIAKIFEAIVFEQAEQNNWFGESAVTIGASRYDDIVNKVDTIVEFDEEAGTSHMALGMDVTTAQRFAEKFEHIRQGILQGQLTRIKYFISESMGFRGEKTGVPHVVIGVDRKTLFDVIELWSRGDNKSLSKHPVQTKILLEIQLQLNSYRKLADKLGHTKVVQTYDRTLSIIDKVIEEKGINESDLKVAEEDRYFSAIQRAAEDISLGNRPEDVVIED